MTARHSNRGRRHAARSRTVRGLAIGAAATLAAGTLAQPAHAATGTEIFDLSADAIALNSTTTDPGIPLGIPFSVGSYGASSQLNSNGESSSDAGSPYSPLVSSLPNTGNGVAYSSFGYSLPVVPKFPGYVAAKDPVTPAVKQNAGGYELDATAKPEEARGAVNIGAQKATAEENNAFAYAHSIANADGVLTEASAGVHALTFTGIMDLANFSSYASLTRGPDGKTVPVVRTNLGTISFADLTSGLTGRGFTMLGSAPTPITPDGLNALNGALKPAGITLTYLPATYTYTDGSNSTGPAADEKKTLSGLVSGALQIAFANTSSRGTSTETVTIGRVAVTATSTHVVEGTSTPATAPSANTPAAALLSTGSAPVTPVESGPVAAALPADVPVATEPAAQIPTEAFVPAASMRIDPQGRDDFGSSYAVIVLTAAVVLLAGQVIRLASAKVG